MNQFLKLRQALCRALGRLPDDKVDARQKAASIIADIDDWNMWEESRGGLT